MSKNRILFVLKRREIQTAEGTPQAWETGLFNSVRFVNTMLEESGIESKCVSVVDNNRIDKEVHDFRPTHVIIEGLWVVPSKFSILTKLHPNVVWIVRLHSDMPFLSNEGIALDWCAEYVKFSKILIAPNAPRLLDEMKFYLSLAHEWDPDQVDEKIVYLPNYYPTEFKTKHLDVNKPEVNIGCFGAIRPLKNHLIQAVAALMFAERNVLKLRFHINANRVEQNGGPNLKNIEALFLHVRHAGHELICHDWCPREEFLRICASMDIGLQVSFTETFNIVAADLISQGVPVVMSHEIPWASHRACANPTDSYDIAEKLNKEFYDSSLNVRVHQESLREYTTETRRVWDQYFGEH